MASKTSLKDFEPFFGGDQKGAFLVQAMFNGTNYTDRHGFNSGLMSELLRSANYKNTQNVRSSGNGQSQGSEDVHQDITDLIITTALFHRSIDKSSTAGTNLGAAIDAIANAVKEYLSAPVSPVDVYATASTTKTNIATTYNSSTNSQQLLYALADRAVWDASHFAFAKQSLSANTDSEGKTHDDIIKALINCNTITSLCDAVTKAPEAVKAFTDLENAGVTRAKQVITDAIAVSLHNVLATIIGRMKQDVLDTYSGISTLGRTASRPTDNVLGKLSVATVNNFVSNNTHIYKRMLEDLINAGASEAIRSAIRSSVTVAHTTLNVNSAKKFFDAVFKAWPSMDSDIKQFYGQNISIFAKNDPNSSLYDHSNDQYRKQHLTTDWIRLTPAELDDLFKQDRVLSVAELSQLRVNLMKSSSSGYKDVLFGSNLPDVPNGSNVWYTQNNGALNHVIAPPADFLRQLYNAIYESGINSATVNVTYSSPAHTFVLSNVENNLEVRPKEQFALNIGKFTAAAIKREDDQVEQASVAQQTGKPVGTLDDYTFLTAYDTVYGKLWTFDVSKGQYYRVDENNRKVYYDDAAKGDVDTCYASYLAKGSSAGCLRVIQCIADGNSKSLNRCLDVIGDGDLWKVASDDVQKVGPDMVKLVLRKFGVQGYEETDSNGVKYKVPMSFEEWKKDVVSAFPEDVKQTILSNERLLNYLQGLIGVCRANPNILNKNNPNIIARDTTPDYIRNLNMRKYKIPNVSKKSQYEFFAESLRLAVQPHVVTQDLFNPITSGSFSNVAFVSPYTTAVPAMVGGNFYSTTVPSLISRGTGDVMDRQAQIVKNGSASMFSSLLATINNAFADTGLQLHPDDIARLTSVIKKLETYENQLARLCSVLINIVKIARFYGISLENVDKDHPRIMKLSDLHTIDDIRDFIRGYARELTKNMVANMSIQQSAAYELMQRVSPRLIDDCTGKQDQSSSSRQLVQI